MSANYTRASKASRANDTRGFGAMPTDTSLTRGEIKLAEQMAVTCRRYDGHSTFMLDMRRRALTAGWLPTRGQAKVITKILRDEHR